MGKAFKCDICGKLVAGDYECPGLQDPSSYKRKLKPGEECFGQYKEWLTEVQGSEDTQEEDEKLCNFELRLMYMMEDKHYKRCYTALAM